REKLAFRNGQLGDAICMLLQPATEGVILSTCNRMEIYAVVGHAASGTPDAWQEALDSESLELVRLGLTDRAKERIIRVLLGPDETELAEKRQFVDNSHAKSRLSPISTGGNEQ
ncbi:MAG: hypothetical protein M1343_14810, partial [Chloroflexi bacterium]|nr:hypothetical protein [Chloroflexota bacterium]